MQKPTSTTVTNKQLSECILGLAETNMQMTMEEIIDQAVIDMYVKTAETKAFLEHYIKTGSIDDALLLTLSKLHQASIDERKISGAKFIPILILMNAWKKEPDKDASLSEEYMPAVKTLKDYCEQAGSKASLEYAAKLSELIDGREDCLDKKTLTDIISLLILGWRVFEKMPETYKVLSYTVDYLQPFTGEEDIIVNEFLWKFLFSLNNIAID